MSHELRWNPVLKEWIIIGSDRKNRPDFTSEINTPNCPFCPDSSEMNGRGEIAVLPNKFPCLLPNPSTRITTPNNLYKTKSAIGFCEIVVETSKHKGDLCDLSIEQFYNVIKLFTKRYEELGSNKNIKYVFIFRNKGKEIGATIHHPHSQIYALPFIPPIIKQELISSKEYMKKHKECLFCNIIKKEIEEKKRVILKNGLSICFLPFYAKWAYETHIFPVRHIQSLSELKNEEIKSIAYNLKAITSIYNNLFGFSMPYVMTIHQKPADGKNYSFYHFHIEFCPVYQSKNRIKYTAGIERIGTFEYGAGTPEEKAEELRQVYENIIKKGGESI